MLTESLRELFNQAVDHGVDGVVPAGTPVGIARLSHVLRVYNAMMGGGVYFAMEVARPDELERAVEGLRYLGLIEEADLLAGLVDSLGSADPDEEKEERLYDLLTEGQPVDAAFRRKAAEVPADFGL